LSDRAERDDESDRVEWDDCLEEDHRWLFRGVFLRSPDDDWMRDENEIVPPRPDRVGRRWRHQHINGDTDTAYTSWSTNWETARMFGEEARTGVRVRGEVVVFRVRIDTLTNRGYFGREDEDEILIEGSVEDVEISTGLEEEEENE
jgi:hypothetical protein